MVSKVQLAGWAVILVILSASVYVLLPESVRVDVQNTKTVFRVWESGGWVVGGVEYLHLYDGSRKMRAKDRNVTESVDGDIITIVRSALWKEGVRTVHTYVFDAGVSDVSLIPISSSLSCYGCVGKIVHFEYRDLSYGGVTRSAVSPELFGHNMKVEWEDGYAWAKVYQQKVASDKLIIRYRPDSSVVEYNVRLFDPVPDGASPGIVFEGDGKLIFQRESSSDGDGSVVFQR